MRAAEADILFVPGLSGSGPDHWQSRWEKKLSTARRITPRDLENPRRDDWVAAIVDAAEAAQRPVALVAHSLGVVATLHAAPKIGERVVGAFLVAPPSESVLLELPGVDKAFAPFPRQPLPFPALLVGSSDDAYADAAFTRDLARDISAEFVDAGPAGHLNVDSGHGPWPEGLLRFAAFLAKL